MSSPSAWRSFTSPVDRSRSTVSPNLSLSPATGSSDANPDLSRWLDVDRLLTSEWWLETAFAGVFGALVSAAIAAFTAVRVLQASARHETDRRDADRLLEKVAVFRSQLDELEAIARNPSTDFITVYKSAHINALTIASWSSKKHPQFARAIQGLWIQVGQGVAASMGADSDPKHATDRQRTLSALNAASVEIDFWIMNPNYGSERTDADTRELIMSVSHAIDLGELPAQPRKRWLRWRHDGQ